MSSTPSLQNYRIVKYCKHFRKSWTANKNELFAQTWKALLIVLLKAVPRVTFPFSLLIIPLAKEELKGVGRGETEEVGSQWTTTGPHLYGGIIFIYKVVLD